MTGNATPPLRERGGHKKARLLYLMRILLEHTDEQHGVTMPQIMEYLGTYGIRAERKSIYDDLSILRGFGLDIRTRKSGSFAYYVGAREFSPDELERLMDAVQGSRMIAPKDAALLHEKIKRQCSTHQAARLRRCIFHIPAPDTGPNQFEDLRDQIHTAIRGGQELSFCEFHWELAGGEKQRVLNGDGETQRVRPYGVLQSENLDYLLAYHSGEQTLRHYRLDRICDVKTGPAAKADHTEYTEAILEDYIKMNFTGKANGKEKIRLEFDSGLLGEVLDRFGGDMDIKSAGKDKFRIVILETADPEFYSWLFRYGTGVKVLAPKHVAEAYRERARAVFKAHKK